MSVKIRLTRIGKKKQPFYRVIAIESSNPRDGKTLEILGTYDPRQAPILFDIKKDRVQYWLSVGAQPSDTVARLLGNAEVIPKPSLKSSKQGVAKKDREKSDKD